MTSKSPSYAKVTEKGATDSGAQVRQPKNKANDGLPNGGVPHAHNAPTSETPKPSSTGDKSVLQAHFDYYDTDKDGVIFPLDTFHGFHKTGFNWFLSIIAVFVIHSSFSYWTLDTWLPDLRFPIYIKNANRCKHGSDTATYDADGNFLPSKFERIFEKHAKKDKDALTFKEIVEMIKTNRNVMDPFGWVASSLEWSALYWVAASDEGKLSKERVRACYDGSLWPILEEENKSKKAQKKAGKQNRLVFASRN